MTLVPLLHQGEQESEFAPDQSDFFLWGGQIPAVEVTSIAEAEKAVGFEISLPSRVPADLSFQSIRVAANTRSVYLVMGPSSLVSNAPISLQSIMDGNWVLIQSPRDLSIEPSDFVDSVVANMDGRVVATTVNGCPGFIVCPGDVNNHLVWWNSTLKYELVTPVDATSAQLMDFAESIDA
jgi:hypothetical protein